MPLEYNEQRGKRPIETTPMNATPAKTIAPIRDVRLRAMAVGLWVALLGASIALSVLAAGHDRLPGDLSIMSWAQDQPTPGTEVSRVARTLGSTEVVLGTGAGLAAALWLARRRREALLLALGLAVLPLLQHGLKELVDRPRPSEELVDLRVGFSSPSFPSGHVMSAALLYGFLLYLSLRVEASRWLRAAVGAVALFMLVLSGPANVYVGVHWPSDVLGGYAWAFVLLLPLLYAREFFLTQRPSHARFAPN